MIGDEVAGLIPLRPANFDRLSITTQRHISTLETVIARQRDVITQLSSINPLGQPGSRVVLDPHHDRQPIGPPYVQPDNSKSSGKYTVVEFNLDPVISDDPTLTVHARITESRPGEFQFEVSSINGSLVVRPHVSNAVHITVDPRR